MRSVPLLSSCFWVLLASNAFAAAASPEAVKALQAKIDELDRSLTSTRQAEASIDSELAKLRKLLKLQQLEIQMGQTELSEMEAKLKESEIKKEDLERNIALKQRALREQLSQLPALQFANPLGKMRSNEGTFSSLHLGLINRLVQKQRQEILELKRLQDEAVGVNEKLREEKIRIGAHVEDLKEKQAVLALNQEASTRKLEKTKIIEAARLREFQEAKVNERHLEAMMHAFGSNPAEANFWNRKGQLLLPVDGAVINQFGKKYDPKTNLYTFHKGIEIAAKSGTPVRAISSGKVVFSGRLGGYRQLLILDHGKQFYSLAGNLGETLRKVGDVVREGDIIGKSSVDETPLYFEIRQRHIAVNPVPWFRDLKVLAQSSAK